MTDIEMTSDAFGYFWCTLLHRKHHVWTGDWKRDCTKCKSWYVWPDKKRIADLVAQPRLVRMEKTTATFSSLPPDLEHGESIRIEGGTNCVIENNVIMGTPICIDCGIQMPEFSIRCDECQATNNVLADDIIE